MTIRLYDEDPYCLEFDAVVTACQAQGDAFAVTLDRTAFFPEGGGQGADHGTLGDARVTDAHEAQGEVVHTVDRPLAPGTEVHASVDAVRRLDMMQQHSGEHIFSGLVHQLHGYDNVGFHIGTEAVTMDFSGPLDGEQILEIERLANEVVWRNVPVRTLLPTKDELAQMTYRSKKALEGTVRIVTIPGADTCACCGTHVRQTGSIGQIKVIGHQSYKGGVRISILCGRRALAYEQAMLEQVKQSTAALSCRQQELSGAVSRVIAERDQLRYQNEQLGLRIFELMASQEADKAVRVVCCDALPASMARRAAGRLCAGAQLGLVLVPREGGYSFALSSQTQDVRPFASALCRAFGGKGGGPRDMAQGVLAGGEPEAMRAVLEGC